MIRPFESLILRNLLGPLIASLQLFLLYVVIHGHYSPGGAFQGGTLLACSLILPLLAHREGFLVIGPRAAVAMSAMGVMIFTGVGIVPMFFGQPLLDYAALPFGAMEAPARRALGTLLIEIGATFTVAGALVSIYYSLDRETEPRGEEAER